MADNDGCYLTFPTFSITVDDSTDCLLAYEIVNPKGFDISTCDYLQDEANQIKTLALTKTRQLEENKNYAALLNKLIILNMALPGKCKQEHPSAVKRNKRHKKLHPWN
jgi:hypothetical protein